MDLELTMIKKLLRFIALVLVYFLYRVTYAKTESCTRLLTPPNSEIICGQKVGTKVVCGIIFFFEKKAMLKI